MKLSDIASLIDGELRGDPDIEITGVAGIEDAAEGDITYLAGLKGVGKALGSGASCVIVEVFIDELKKAQVRVKKPQYAFALLLERYSEMPVIAAGIDERAHVGEGAEVAAGAAIGAFAYVARGAKVGVRSVVYPGAFIGEGSSIGDECIVYPNAVIRDGVTMGDRCIVHSCAVIGADGFGYVHHEGKHKKIPQIGGVRIGDDVEIGACTTIDRATTGMTEIASGTKIDNLVQVAHNVKVGENSILVSQAGIAGSTEVGSNVVIGGQAGIADHVSIADGTILAARTGVITDMKKGIYVGEPATPRKQYLRIMSYFLRLPELNEKIKELEARLKHLERREGE